jgi:hypothetical protein
VFGGAGGVEERSFVAKGAPLDDSQVRLDGRTARLGKEDRSNPHPLLRGAKSAATAIGPAKAGRYRCKYLELRFRGVARGDRG